jgi:hypothetical protein
MLSLSLSDTPNYAKANFDVVKPQMLDMDATLRYPKHAPKLSNVRLGCCLYQYRTHQIMPKQTLML